METFKFKTTPFEHQRAAFERGKARSSYAYFCEMGTGKTKIFLDDLAYNYCAGTIDSCLILAPKGVYTNWSSIEIPKHLSINNYNVFLWQGGTFKQVIKAKDSDAPALDIAVVNVEALSRQGPCYKTLLRDLKKGNWMLGIDESTCVKNYKAGRTKNIFQLSKLCRVRRIMTGSPVTNSPLDLWSQVSMLGEGLLGFSNFVAFRAHYAILKDQIMGSRTFKQVVGYKNLPQLAACLENFSYRILKKDCLDLPEKLYSTRAIEFEGKQKEVYDYLLRDITFWLSNGQLESIKMDSALAKIIRLHQISCGILVKDGEEATSVFDKPEDNPRLQAIGDICDELEEGAKVIIFATYVYNIVELEQFLTTRYGRDVAVTFYGGTRQDEREKAVDRFQNDPKCRFFISNQTGAYGLTLTAASVVIYYSNSYDITLRQQSEDRAHRLGQSKHVTYIDLVAEKTIDEVIIRSLKRKEKIQDVILNKPDFLTNFEE